MIRQNRSNTHRIFVTALFVIAFQTIFALSSSMYSNLVPSIGATYSLPLKGISLINMSREVGNMGAMLLALFLLDRTDKNTMIWLMTLGFGVGMLLLKATPTFSTLLLIWVGIGSTGALVDNLCATYMADLHGEARGKYVSILHAFFAIGSMVGPQVAAYFLTVGNGWTGAYGFMGSVASITALVFVATMLVMKRPVPAVTNMDQTGTRRKIPFKLIFANKNLRWLCIATGLMSSAFYINIWTPSYLQTLDPVVYTVTFCSIITTLGYLGMIISRSLFGILGNKITPEGYLQWSSLFSAVVIVMLLSAGNKFLWPIGILLYGVVNGAQFTARFLLAFREYPEYTSTVAALTSMFGALGGIVFNYVISSIAEKFSYTTGMYTPAVAMVLVFLIFMFVYDKRSIGE